MNRGASSFIMHAWVDADIPGANGLVNDLVTAGTGTMPVDTRRTMPWLHPTTWPGTGQTGDAITRRFKNKAGYLRRSYTDTQLTTIYRHLTDPTASPTGLMMLAEYGGQVNAVPPKATAIAQRDAVMKVICLTTWTDESDDAAHLAWIRAFYRDVYADTGGVPVPGEVSDGSYINYPDADLADPKRNTSGVPWHTLYYKDNYPRLQ